jgi:hypothetical protein
MRSSNAVYCSDVYMCTRAAVRCVCLQDNLAGPNGSRATIPLFLTQATAQHLYVEPERCTP